MMDALRKAEQSAKKLFGDDISFTLARSPAWGNEDCCILIYGRNHAAVACGFTQAIKGDVSITQEEGGGFRGSPTYTYSCVTFAAQAEAA